MLTTVPGHPDLALIGRGWARKRERMSGTSFTSRKHLVSFCEIVFANITCI